MSVCEVCGRTDPEAEVGDGDGISMELLHICESCRADRQPAGTTSAIEKESKFFK